MCVVGKYPLPYQNIYSSTKAFIGKNSSAESNDEGVVDTAKINAS